MKSVRDIRVIPVVMVAIAGFAVLKIAGLVLDGGYVFDYDPHATKPSWAQDQLNFPSGRRDFADITGSVEKNLGLRVLKSGDGSTMVSADGAFRARLLSTGSDPREPEIYEVTLAPGCIEEAPAHPESTHEHAVVLRGQLRVRTPVDEAVLGAGDAVYFCADVPHSYENPGDVETVALLTMNTGGDWVVG